MLVAADIDEDDGRHSNRRIHGVLGGMTTELTERQTVRDVEPQRLDYGRTLPAATRAMRGLEEVVEASTLEPKLRELVKLRASQINGCAFCVDMHTKDAIAIGEDSQRLNMVAVWREAPGFTPRERAALAWTEALTLISQTGASADVYDWMASEFDPEEQVALSLGIVAINGWNRFAIGFRVPAGEYLSHRHSD